VTGAPTEFEVIEAILIHREQLMAESITAGLYGEPLKHPYDCRCLLDIKKRYLKARLQEKWGRR
jgi:hypothetical protein